MIKKLQKIFHTDKWWGKVLFIFTFNALFFPLGTLVYNIFLWIGRLVFNLRSGELFEIFYLCILLPLLSFIFISKIFKKSGIKINRIALFFLNLIILLLMFLTFFLIVYFSVKPNFF